MSDSLTCLRPLHSKLNPYQHEVVHLKDGQYLVSACAGCLSGDTIVEINRAKISFKISIKDLVHKFNGGLIPSGPQMKILLKWDSDIETLIRSRDIDGYVRLFKLHAAVDSGVKQTFKITTANGNTIRATKDHKFLTNNGWKPLGDLTIGTQLFVLKPLIAGESPTKRKPYYLQTSAMYSHPHRTSRGSGRFSVATHRLVMEAYLNGMSYDDYISLFKVRNVVHPTLKFLDPKEFYVHHIDENPQNNELDNLQVLQAAEHSRLHGVAGAWKHVTQATQLDSITKIERGTKEQTYDLTLETEPHNFIANNFVVHNSGKSTVIVSRIEQLIQDGVNPEKIGAFTFAKFAANELGKRLKLLDISTTNVSTLHALCYNIIREDGEHLGGKFLVDDKSLIFYQTKDFIQRNYRGVGLDPKIADSLFGLAKANCMSAHPINEGQDKLPIIELFKKLGDKPWLANAYYNLFEEVEAWKVNKRILNYDDMLYLSWLLLVDHEDIQDKWASKFEYFLIDEAQDSSTVQNAIARMLSKKSNNIMVVGDSLQSLYKWRGANPEEFVAFARQYKVYKLPVNYRSTTDICAAASKLTNGLAWNITGVTQPHAKAATDPTSIIAKEYENPNEEAVGIADQILDLSKTGTSFKDIAVLYRISALLQPIEDALVMRKIPYSVWSGHTFYDRKEIKDLLSYLYVISLHDNTEQWIKRALNVPFRYISRQFIEAVDDVAKVNKYSFIDAMNAYKSPRENVNTSIRKFNELLLAMRKQYVASTKPKAILEYMLAETRYMKTVQQEEGEDGPDPDSGAKLTHVHQLLKIAEGFNTVDTLLDYIARAQTLLAESRKRKGSDAVVLSTIHSVKGMEFDVVFAPGWNEGIIPHLKNPSQDEELRIAYVCLTRAAKQFRCSWNRTQITQGGIKQLPMSKFIDMAGLPKVPLPFKKKPEINIIQWLKDNPEFVNTKDFENG